MIGCGAHLESKVDKKVANTCSRLQIKYVQKKKRKHESSPEKAEMGVGTEDIIDDFTEGDDYAGDGDNISITSVGSAGKL